MDIILLSVKHLYIFIWFSGFQISIVILTEKIQLVNQKPQMLMIYTWSLRNGATLSRYSHTQSSCIYLGRAPLPNSTGAEITAELMCRELALCVSVCMYTYVCRVCVDCLGPSCGFRHQELGMLITEVWSHREPQELSSRPPSSLPPQHHSLHQFGLICRDGGESSSRHWADVAGFFALW